MGLMMDRSWRGDSNARMRVQNHFVITNARDKFCRYLVRIQYLLVCISVQIPICVLWRSKSAVDWLIKLSGSWLRPRYVTLFISGVSLSCISHRWKENTFINRLWMCLKSLVKIHCDIFYVAPHALSPVHLIYDCISERSMCNRILGQKHPKMIAI